jgi:hypothetical protein
MTAGGNEPDLSAFQLEVARLFFALPASHGFLLAGGAALLAQHLTARPTEDLDFFTAPERGHVPAACDALEVAARERGWTVQRIHDSDTFCRMVIRSIDAGVLVDLAVMRRRTFRPPRPRPGRRLRQKNSPGISCSPCSTGPPHETSPTSTFWRSGSARTSCSHGPPRSTQASTPRYSRACSPPSTGSRTMRSQCPKARLQPNSERSTQPGDQSLHDKPDQLIVRGPES